MARLVHGAEQTREGVAGIEARGHPDIARYTLRERVLALVQTAPIEPEAQGLEDLERQLTLARHAELAAERDRRAVGLNFDGLVDQARELARQGLEDGVDIRG